MNRHTTANRRGREGVSVPARTRPSAVLAVVGLAVSASLAAAQSDPSLFSFVKNLPQDGPTISGQILADTQLNVYTGGTVLAGFIAGDPSPFGFNVEVNLLGGTFQTAFTASSGSTINLLSGSAGAMFQATNGSVVNLFGGSIGDQSSALIGSVLNVDGGELGNQFFAGAGSHINIDNGIVGTGFKANLNSHIQIRGGVVRDEFFASAGSDVQITGGTFGDGYHTATGSSVEIYGGEFRIDGQPLADSIFVLDYENFELGALFTGTLLDGSVFIFSTEDGDSFAELSLHLNDAGLPPADPTPVIVVNRRGPRGLRPGQTLTLGVGSTACEFFAAVGSTLIVDGGSIGAGLETTRSTVRLISGQIGPGFEALEDTTLSVEGGTIGEGARLLSTSRLTMSGGSIADGFVAERGSTVVIAGGKIENDFINRGSLHIKGGEIFPGFLAEPGSNTVLDGGNIYNVNVASGAVVNVLDGSLSTALARAQSVINIFGGEARSLVAQTGSTINMYGGVVKTEITVEDDAIVNLFGGSAGLKLINYGGPATVTGGEVTSFIANYRSIALLSGGAYGPRFQTKPGSMVVMAGGEFQIDAQPIDNLDSGLASEVLFTGTLADATPFIFTTRAADSIEPDTLTLTRVPLPPPAPPRSVSTGTVPVRGLRAGEELTISGDALLPGSFAVVDATLNIQGGTVGIGLEAARGTVNIGGDEPIDIDAYSGSTVNVSGGGLVSNVYANPGTVFNISGGQIGGGFRAEDSSRVTVSGGTIQSMSSHGDSEMLISGGRIGSYLAHYGSHVEIRGGLFETDVEIRENGQIEISGGVFGRRLSVSSLTPLVIRGGEFRVNGEPVATLPEDLGIDDVFTGTFEDGTVFVLVFYPEYEGDDFCSPASTTLVPVELEPAGTEPMTVLTGEGPSGGLRPGQNLTLDGDATLRDFYDVVEAQLTMPGGTLGVGAELVGSNLIVTGGSVGDQLAAFLASSIEVAGGFLGSDAVLFDGSALTQSEGQIGDRLTIKPGGSLTALGGTIGQNLLLEEFSTAHIDGGVIGDGADVVRSGVTMTSGQIGPGLLIRSESRFDLLGGTIGAEARVETTSVLNVMGGQIGNSLDLASNAIANISGGQIDKGLNAFKNSTVNISGGQIGDDFDASSESRVNYFGSEFKLNGVPIAGLTPDTPTTIATRNVTLSGVLVDGTPFELDLNSANNTNTEYVDPNAILTVTLMPPVCQADVNGDGFVDQGDIQSYVTIFLAQDPAADQNGDGFVDLGDIGAFIAAFLGGC